MECRVWTVEGMKVGAYFSIPREVDFQCFAVVFKAQGGHCEEDVFAVDSFALFLLAFLRCWWRVSAYSRY